MGRKRMGIWKSTRMVSASGLMVLLHGLVSILRVKAGFPADLFPDLLFSNIKNLFFQTIEKELIVLIHVHLKAPILLGKKKTSVCPLPAS